MTVADIAAAIEREGQTMLLRRFAGKNRGRFDVGVKGVVRGYQPSEIAGDIQQGDREVRISNAEIAARHWPGPPRRGDRLRIDGAWVNVESNDARKLREDYAMHIMQVRG